MLYDKWWKEKQDKMCPKTKDVTRASALNVVNIGGVFVVLLCGLSVAVLVSVLEFVLKSKKSSQSPITRNGVGGVEEKDGHSLVYEFFNNLWPLLTCGSQDRPQTRTRADCERCSKGQPGSQGVRYT